jgi:hypothetical protein
MKGLANSLRDLGEPVADRTLVLNLLRGLIPRYGHLKALIKRSVPFPTFHAVRNELLLEELTMANEAPTPASTLYSAPTSGQPPSGGQATRPPSTGALLPALHLPSQWPLVRLQRPTEVVAPARATVGVADPLVVVPPARVAAPRGHPSTTPGPGPSPCGWARHRVPPVPWRRPS